MAPLDLNHPPLCSIDFPMELTPDEIVSLSGPINTLLKSNYLLGAALEPDAIFNSLFDIAEEIAQVEACGLLRRSEVDPNDWEVAILRSPGPPPDPEHTLHHIAPGSIACHFGKAVLLDPEREESFRETCDAWGSRSLLSCPIRRDRDIVGALVFGKKESHPFTNVQVKLLWVLAMQAQNYLQRNESINAKSVYSFLEPLTHLYNRPYFNNQLEKEILRSRRSGESFTLLMLDIDDFREYNVRFLIASGDIALQEFAGILGGSVREVDTVARMGGSGFAVILLESNSEGALALANRIIQRFRRHLLPGSDGSRTERLNASIGIASFPADSFDLADLLSKAKRALYAAREQGGGRACPYHEIAGNGHLKPGGKDLPVNKIFDASRSVVDMDKFLEILLFTAMQGLGAGRGSIVVKDPGGDFSLTAAVGFDRYDEHLTAAGRFHPGPVTQWVLTHQLPLVVSRPEDSPVGHPFKKNGYLTESFLSLPLTHHGQTLGALHLTNRMDQRPFTREDLKAFGPIASEIAKILAQGTTFRENVRSFSLSILSSLSGALELRFPFLSGHAVRVRDLSVRVGQRMGLGDGDLDALRHAAALHDVGIVGIPGDILAKAGNLSEEETELVRKHPFLGSKMLEGVPGMDAARRTILEHHENFDGTGYPYGLRGEDISMTARILSVSEVFDSLVSPRPYRDGFLQEEAARMVKAGENTLFDREVCNVFFEELRSSSDDRIC
jgi:diguanylate cyclase (GGDEF)-like protein